jgi:glycosyltransferase involved in cell wall biosynthesis
MSPSLRVFQAMSGAALGGAEAFFERLAPAFVRAGVPQRVAIRRDPRRAKLLRAQGVDLVELGFRGPLDIATRLALMREIRRFAPDVVLGWMNRACAALPPRAIMRGTRYVAVGRLGGYYDLKYYRRCDWLIGNTPDIRDYVVRQGWPAARAAYVPNFVDATPSPPVDRSAFATPSDAPLALALGRLHPNKAFDVLIAAAAALPDLHVWIAGEGPLGADLRAQAARLGIAGRIRFLGWREDIPALLAAADLLVCPSRHEPLGNVVIEAWAHGRPVVAAASAGPRQLIRDGETGLLVPVDDATALARAIASIAHDRARGAELAAAGRAAYEAEFTEAAVVQRYLSFFADIAGRR